MREDNAETGSYYEDKRSMKERNINKRRDMLIYGDNERDVGDKVFMEM